MQDVITQSVAIQGKASSRLQVTKSVPRDDATKTEDYVEVPTK